MKGLATTKTFRADINALRALAVAMVVLFHINPARFRGGFIGVDIFFVISGYLMTRIILGRMHEGRFSLWDFWQARFARIVPALAILCLTVLAFGAVFIEPSSLKETAKEVVGALTFTSNIQFWLSSGYFDTNSKSKWLLHTWSLSVEWWFYILYPLLMMLLARFITTARVRLMLLCVFLLASLALSVVAAQFSGRIFSFGFYMLPPRAWEMLAGGVVAAIPGFCSTWSRSSRAFAAVFGLVMILGGLVFFSEFTPWPSFYSLVPVVGTALIIAAAPAVRLFDMTPVRQIGASSYSIYLWHWPILVALRYFDIKGPAFTAIALVGALACGWLSYRFVEQPASDWLKNSRTRARPLITAAAASVLAVLSLGVMATDGLDFRVAGDRNQYKEALEASGDRMFEKAGCRGGLERTGEVRPCVVGYPTAGRDVLVIGDPFAEQWFPRAKALEPLLRDHAVVFITKGGCPPIPGAERLTPSFACAAFHRAAISAARQPRYRTVVYAGMWTSYFRHTAPQLDVTATDAVARLESEIDTLRAAGKHVVVLTTAPYPDKDFTALYRRLSFEGRKVSAGDSDFDFNKVRRGSDSVDDMLRGLASNGVTVIDPYPSLCRSRCPLMVDAHAIYSDSAHLRSSYTANVGGFLDPTLLH